MKPVMPSDRDIERAQAAYDKAYERWAQTWYTNYRLAAVAARRMNKLHQLLNSRHAQRYPRHDPASWNEVQAVRRDHIRRRVLRSSSGVGSGGDPQRQRVLAESDADVYGVQTEAAR